MNILIECRQCKRVLRSGDNADLLRAMVDEEHWSMHKSTYGFYLLIARRDRVCRHCMINNEIKHDAMLIELLKYRKP